MATQADIYARLESAELDPELSWTEKELPERERTKHVHRLHPYLGKYVPQLVEIFLNRHSTKSSVILDPFAGSGTTLVECSVFGCASVGVDISAFNALLCRVKTAAYNPFIVERNLRAALADLEGLVRGHQSQLTLDEVLTPPKGTRLSRSTTGSCNGLTRRPSRTFDLSGSHQAYPETEDLMRIVLSRSARSARLVTHFGLDFPKEPQTEPYYCRKHSRICQPTREAYKFLRRYTLDTIRRVKEYERLRAGGRTVHHGDSRSLTYGSEVRWPHHVTAVSGPDRLSRAAPIRVRASRPSAVRSDEIGAAEKGTSKAAVSAYVTDMSAVFANARQHMRKGALASLSSTISAVCTTTSWVRRASGSKTAASVT